MPQTYTNGVRKMALKYKIDESEFGELDESMQAFYRQGDDGYTLDVEGVDTGEELKRALEHERSDRAQAKEELEKLRKQQADAEKQAAEEKGEFEKLYKQTQSQLEQEREEKRKFYEQIQQRDVKSSASEIARQLAAKDAKRADVLADYASRYAKYDNGEVIYEIGGVKVAPEKVAEHLKSEYPFLVDGPQSSGGGAAGDGGGAPKGKTVTRQQWDSMGHNDRASFAKDGGKVVESE